MKRKRTVAVCLFCNGISISKILRSVWWHEIYLKWIAFDLVICCLDLKLHLTHHFPCQKMYQYSPQQQIPQGKGMYLFTLSTGKYYLSSYSAFIINCKYHSKMLYMKNEIQKYKWRVKSRSYIKACVSN